LEAQSGSVLALKARAWLGHTLTGAERAELAAIPDEPYRKPTEADMAGWSPELREWLRAKNE
jgi:hypothetical protein